MNLLARILSHGFAFTVAALILLVFVYRGEIFEDWDLPGFLAVDSQSETNEQAKPKATDPVEGGVTEDVATVESSPPEEDADEAASARLEASPVDHTPTATPESEKMPAETAAAEKSHTETTAVPPATTPPANETQTDPDIPTAGKAPELSENKPTAAATETISDPAVIAATGDEASHASGDKSAIVEPVAPVDDSRVNTPEPVDTATDATQGSNTNPSDETDETSAELSESTAATPTIAPLDDSAISAEDESARLPEERQADTVAATEPVADTPDEETSAYAVLAGAREAYWLREFDKAEQQYRQLIQLDPDNPDGYGELGNMYFSQGKWEQAAAAYYEAGVLLLDEGLIVQARQMVEVIRGLNGSQADKLETKIADSFAATP